MPYTAVQAQVSVRALPQVQLRARGERYRFSDAAVSTPLVSVEQSGWRGELGMTASPAPSWTFDAGYTREFGPGAASVGTSASITYAPAAGPYAVTRHPIYTGLVGMLLGTALLAGLGQWIALLVVGLIVAELKIHMEEDLLVSVFGEEYRRYRLGPMARHRARGRRDRKRRRLGPSPAGRAAMITTGLLVLTLLQQPGQGFDHSKHGALFPSCTSCHAGTVTKGASLWPDPVSCTTCHDGTIEKTVAWRPPTSPRRTNLRFDHLGHAVKAKDTSPSCSVCHTLAGEPRMAVRAPVVQRCLLLR